MVFHQQVQQLNHHLAWVSGIHRLPRLDTDERWSGCFGNGLKPRVEPAHRRPLTLYHPLVKARRGYTRSLSRVASMSAFSPHSPHRPDVPLSPASSCVQAAPTSQDTPTLACRHGSMCRTLESSTVSSAKMQYSTYGTCQPPLVLQKKHGRSKSFRGRIASFDTTDYTRPPKAGLPQVTRKYWRDARKFVTSISFLV